MRTYPVPGGAGSVTLDGARCLAATGDSWAEHIVAREQRAVDRALVASACDPHSQHYGVLDPDVTDNPLIVAVVAVDLEGRITRWNGSGWDEVPVGMDPSGFELVALEDEALLADAISARGGLLLRPTVPKAHAVLAAGATGSVFAVVDDFDTSAVLDVFRAARGAISVRKNGKWEPDSALASRLRSVDPPRVLVVPAEQVAEVVQQVDAFDATRAVTAATIAWDESKYKRDEGGKFAPKDGGGENGRPSMTAEQLREYVATGKLPAGVIGENVRKFADEAAAKKAKKAKGGKGKGKGGGDAAKKAEAAKKKAEAAAKKEARAKEVAAKKAEAATKKAETDAKREVAKKARSADLEYDITRNKARLAEDERRSALADEMKAEAEAIKSMNPRDAWAAKEALTARVKEEMSRREEWDKASKYEAEAERIRRLERKQAALTAGGPPATTAMPPKLRRYWTRGKGAAKIRWGTGGDFNRCRRALAKYLRPDQIPGACANLHKVATGTWPGKGKSHGVSAAAYGGDGGMIAFVLPPEVSSKLRVPGGNPEDELHVTLAYLGEDVPPEVADRAASALDGIEQSYSIPTTLGGRGTFDPDGDPVHYASVDAPGIEYLWAEIVDRLNRAGVAVPTEHGFTPHVTLKYGDMPESDWPDLPVETTLGRIELRTGNRVHRTWELAPY